MTPEKKSKKSKGLPDRSKISRLGERKKETEIDYAALIPLIIALIANFTVLIYFLF